MPHYDYQCTFCGHKEEFFQKITEDSLTKCPQCQRETFKRKFGGGLGLQFQGSGFYSTDYNSSHKPASSETSETSSPSSNKGCGCGKSSCKA